MTFNNFKLAHFNPKELAELDSWQGGRTDAAKNLRHLSGVEELFSNPANEKLIMKMYEHHAKGGRIGELLQEADRMRHKGRHGDNESALIGPHTERVFNRIMHTDEHRNKNPHTGHPEFFNLGGYLGHMGRTLNKGFGKVGGALAGGVNKLVQGPMRKVANYGMNAIPSMIQGGLEGGPEGALAGGAASMMNQASGGNSPDSIGGFGKMFMDSPMGKSAQSSNYGQMANNAYNTVSNAYNTGKKFMDSPTGQAAQSYAMNSPQGKQMMQKAAPYVNQGMGMYNQAKDMYNQADQGYQQMMQQGNPIDQRAQQRMRDMQQDQRAQPVSAPWQ